MFVKDFEDDDPMEIRAVKIPGVNLEAQARAFMEEFLSIGTSEKELHDIFRNPYYMGPRDLYKQLGKEKIQSLIERCVKNYGNVKSSVIEYHTGDDEENFQESIDFINE